MKKLFSEGIPQELYVLEILRAARRLESEGDRLFHHYRLSVSQFNVLNLLKRYQPMPQSELSRNLVVGKATVSSVVAGLLKRRLVIQISNTKDRRAKMLSLSSSGLSLWKRASQAYLEGLKQRLPAVDIKLVELTQEALKPCTLLKQTA